MKVHDVLLKPTYFRIRSSKQQKKDTLYTNTKMGYEEKLQTAFFIQAGLTTRTVTK